MLPDWLPGVISTVVGNALILALVGYIKSRDDERMTKMEQDIRGSAPDVLRSQVKRLEQDYELLHSWKNTIYPAQVESRQREVYTIIETIGKQLGRRVARIERFLNGKLNAFRDRTRDDN